MSDEDTSPEALRGTASECNCLKLTLAGTESTWMCPLHGESGNVKLLNRRIEELEDTQHRIESWCKAYPLEVFPEPDFDRAHEVLKAAGMGIDSISASNMRHVLTGIRAIIDGTERIWRARG